MIFKMIFPIFVIFLCVTAFAAEENKSETKKMESYQSISVEEKESRNINGIYVLYWTVFTHPGPKPGRAVGTKSWVGHRFFVSSAPFKRKEILNEEDYDSKKFHKVHFSFWTKKGDFKLNGKSYNLQVLEDKVSNNVSKAEELVQAPISIKIDSTTL
jgi:hypothetical protein